MHRTRRILRGIEIDRIAWFESMAHADDYQDPAVRTELFRVHELMLQVEPDLVIPPCPDGACACAWHRARSRPSPSGGGGP